MTHNVIEQDIFLEFKTLADNGDSVCAVVVNVITESVDLIINLMGKKERERSERNK